MAVYCSRCNTANREGSRYCNSCGADLASPPEATCPVCKAAVPAYSTFCHHCGAALGQPDTAPVTPPPPVTEMDDDGPGASDEEADVISLDQVPATLLPGKRRPLEANAAAAAAIIPPLLGADASRPTAAADAVPAPAVMDAEEAEAAAAGAALAVGVDVTVLPPPKVRVRRSPSRGYVPSRPATAVKSNWWDDHWRHIAYVSILAAVVIGLLLPVGALGRATAPTPEVQALYDAIEALPRAAVVLVSFDYDAATADEMRPLAEAIVVHLAQRQARLMAMSLLPQGPALADSVIQPIYSNRTYGVDYVNLGYLAGDEAALASLSSSLSKAFGADYVYQMPATDIPMVRGVSTISSVDLVIDIAADDSSLRRWLEQVRARSGVSLGAATSAAAMPLAYPYLQSGQLAGLASGLPAAAQYESLLDYTGQATKTLNAQSLGHIAIVLLVVAANAGLLVVARRKRVVSQE